MSFTGFSFARNANLQMLKAADDKQLDTIPEGFNNSIRWNAGHVLVIVEKVLSHSDSYENVLPGTFFDYFDMGTNPADWKGTPPSPSEIEAVSGKQLQAIEKLLAAETELTKPFELLGVSFTNLTDVMAFLSFHEGMHFTTIKTYLALTK